MVKPLKTKLDILTRLKNKRKYPTRTHAHAEVVPTNKGEYLGLCNRRACLKPGAEWYNWSTQKYYCAECAHWLNCDQFNARDAQRMYGHELCTLGEPGKFTAQIEKPAVNIQL